MHCSEIQISAFHAIAIDSVAQKRQKKSHMLKYKCCNVIEKDIFIYRNECVVLLNIMRQNILISYIHQDERKSPTQMTYIIVASKKQLGSQYFTKLNLQHMCIVFLVTNFFPRNDDAHVHTKIMKMIISMSVFSSFFKTTRT